MLTILMNIGQICENLFPKTRKFFYSQNKSSRNFFEPVIPNILGVFLFIFLMFFNSYSFASLQITDIFTY